MKLTVKSFNYVYFTDGQAVYKNRIVIKKCQKNINNIISKYNVMDDVNSKDS